MPLNRRMFDPEVYRVVLLDQRGAGKSKPLSELKVHLFIMHMHGGELAAFRSANACKHN